MIAVVADDFTGAAELGAIGLRHGLSAEIRTAFREPCDADLVVLDTNSRSVTREEAVARVAGAVGGLAGTRPEWVFKKVDSVLRGHVVGELEAALDGLGLERALLVPNNPSYGQSIRDGRYSIEGRPLAETGFALDPEFPAVTSTVMTLLGRPGGREIAWRDCSEDLPAAGIVVSGGNSVAELEVLAGRLDETTLAAGAAEFFAAALRIRLGVRDGRVRAGIPERPPRRVVFILGSSSEPSRTTLARGRERGIPVVTLPLDLARGEGSIDPWVAEVVEGLAAKGRAIVAFERDVPGQRPPLPAGAVPGALAELAGVVAERAPDGETHLFVEGGTTASTVIRGLGWDRLTVLRQEGPGVVTLGPPGEPDRRITVKPGNYPWPESILGWVDGETP